jgi:hypothetical protein
MHDFSRETSYVLGREANELMEPIHNNTGDEGRIYWDGMQIAFRSVDWSARSFVPVGLLV